ncbi:MAG: nuclear transport factor 2 family protein [Thermoleophilaceae bacterium]
MSERAVELHRRIFDAFNERDVEALIDCVHPQFELHSKLAALAPSVYEGHGGLRRWHQDLEDSWEGLRAEPEAYFDLGEQTLAVYVLRARGRQSGLELALPIAALVRWRDGLARTWVTYENREDALRDLGVSEDALEPIAP